ncbi:MAG: type II toxin-antitoxin system RelE/ParE family toxin [Desulfovibrionaceae bacterium]|nr:type II toxin-antitoxin system RelE/ParE family toxin [Desulfovibrionaceae bacterium]
MAWRIEFEAEAKKEFANLDRQVQERIRKFLRERIAVSENPRDFGEPLRRNLTGLWKYRVGDYRIIAEIADEKVLVVVLRIGHRRKVYGGH